MHEIHPAWEFVSDGVMGGVSRGAVSRETVAGRSAARLTGAVSLDNNGGFLQMAFDLAAGDLFDASGYTGVALTVLGNDQNYDLRLRTDALTRPWQSFRAAFHASPQWRDILFPFADFSPNKTDAVLDPARLRRIGILAVGREMDADIAVASVGFYS